MSIASPRRTRLLVALLGTLAVAAYATLAALQILVLNPLAAAPGRSLGEIHADLAAMNENLGMPVALGILGFGVALALLMLALLPRRSDMSARVIVGAYLLLLAGGAPAYFVASFGAGMALADTYGISGGDYAVWGRVLYTASFAALIAVVPVFAVRSRSGGRAERADARGDAASVVSALRPPA